MPRGADEFGYLRFKSGYGPMSLHGWLMSESKNLFLGIIGHDLRNPIGAASMAGEALKKLSTPDSKQMALASHVVDATQRGLQILNDLLEVTRSAFGTDIPVVRAPMDMASVARRIVAEMQSLSKGRRIDVTTDGDTNGAWDETRIGQVFSNLIGNAVEYSLPDSAISVAVKGAPSNVLITVHNLGAPIPADDLDNLFENVDPGPVGGERAARFGTSRARSLHHQEDRPRARRRHRRLLRRVRNDVRRALAARVDAKTTIPASHRLDWGAWLVVGKNFIWTP